jgi:uncharacterized protein
VTSDPNQPWYKEGLRFECTQCGKCCTGQPGFIWVTEEEMRDMAQELAMSLELFKRKYTRQRDNRYLLVEKKSQGNACVFLKDNKCQIYKVRPKQCRTFPWWKENLTTKESWLLAASECEGISESAPLIPLAEIKRHL